MITEPQNSTKTSIEREENQTETMALLPKLKQQQHESPPKV